MNGYAKIFLILLKIKWILESFVVNVLFMMPRLSNSYPPVDSKSHLLGFVSLINRCIIFFLIAF